MIEILEIECAPHRLFHVSPKEFSFPCRNEINAARAWSRWHANGVLGLWCSTFPRMCAAFGKQVYEVELKEGARAIGLPFSDFQALTSDMEDFSDLIAFLCAQGDVAYLVDGNPYVGEVIVLNFEAIERFTNVTTHQLSDAHAPLKIAA